MNYIEWVDKVWVGLRELWGQLNAEERAKGIDARSLEEHLSPDLAGVELEVMRKATSLALEDLGLRGVGSIVPRHSKNRIIYIFPDAQTAEKQAQSRSLLKGLDGREKWLLRAVASRAERQYDKFATVEMCNVKVIYQVLWGKWDADASQKVQQALCNLSKGKLVLMAGGDKSTIGTDEGQDEDQAEILDCRPTYAGMMMVQELSKRKSWRPGT